MNNLNLLIVYQYYKRCLEILFAKSIQINLEISLNKRPKLLKRVNAFRNI